MPPWMKWEVEILDFKMKMSGESADEEEEK